MCPVSDGQPVSASVTNSAFLDKQQDDATTGKLGLKNGDAESGPKLNNAQRLLNKLAGLQGLNISADYAAEADDTGAEYASTEVVADGDSTKIAIGKLDAQLGANSGAIAAHAGAIAALEGEIVNKVGQAALDAHEADTTGIHGIADTAALATKDGAETLTNKTVGDALTLTEIATPAAPGAGLRKVYAKSDGKLYHRGSDGTEKAVGSGGGSGGLNILCLNSSYAVDGTDNADAETSAGQWATYEDAAATSPVDMTGGAAGLTFTRETGSPLNGAASFQLATGASSRQGQGASLLTYVPPGYRGLNLTFEGVFSITGAIVEDDVRLFAYDVTNSTLITPFTKSKILGSNGKFQAIIAVPSTCEQLRVGFHVARTSTANLTIKFDDLKLTDVSVPVGLNGSPIADYTPTFGGFGTVSGVKVQSEVIGSSLRVWGTATSGTVAASAASIGMPSGRRLATSWLNNKMVVGQIWRIEGATPAYAGSAHGPWPLFYDGSDTTTLFVAKNTSGGAFQKANGADLLNNSIPFAFEFTVPLEGMSSNVTLAESSTFRISSYLANGTRVASTPTKLGEWRAQTRSGSSRTYSDNAPTTTPSASDGIRIFATGTWSTADTSTNPTRYEIFIGVGKHYRNEWYLNTGRTGYIDTAPGILDTSRSTGFSTSYNPTTGVLTVLSPTPLGSNGTSAPAIGLLSNGDFQVGTSAYFDVIVSENALAVGVQEGPVVVARNTAGTSIPDDTSTTVPFATKSIDTHSAWSTDTFTAPMAGKYDIFAQVGWDSFTNFSDGALWILKNGSSTEFQAMFNQISSTMTQRTWPISGTVELNQGDTISLRVNCNNSPNASRALITTAGVNFITIRWRRP